MSWARIDDQIFLNRKVVRAGRDARDLYLAGLAYCAAQLTDGAIDREAIALFGPWALIDDVPSAVERLVAVGLWEPTEVGYRVHDYEIYNEPAAVQRERKAAAERAKAEGRRKGREAVVNGPGGRWVSRKALEAVPTASPTARADAQASASGRYPSPSQSPDDAGLSDLSREGARRAEDATEALFILRREYEDARRAGDEIAANRVVCGAAKALLGRGADGGQALGLYRRCGRSWERYVGLLRQGIGRENGLSYAMKILSDDAGRSRRNRQNVLPSAASPEEVDDFIADFER